MTLWGPFWALGRPLASLWGVCWLHFELPGGPWGHFGALIGGFDTSGASSGRHCSSMALYLGHFGNCLVIFDSCNGTCILGVDICNLPVYNIPICISLFISIDIAIDRDTDADIDVVM